jgi:hypothetical protein
VRENGRANKPTEQNREGTKNPLPVLLRDSREYFYMVALAKKREINLANSTIWYYYHSILVVA